MSQAARGDGGSRIEYRFGDFALDPDRATLHRSGRIRRLRPQCYEVLRYLVEHHGTLVSKKDLIDTVWHGAEVSDDSVTQCLIEIRRALGDDSKSIIRTVPRRGFVFELPVVRQQRDHAQSPRRYRDRWSRRVVIGAAMLLALVAGAAWFATTGREGPDPPDSRQSDNEAPASKKSIAVLPFVDTSDGRDLQYFADSLADGIIGSLARSPDIGVIAWNSSFLASQLSSDSVGIGDRLDVDYVLAGSFSKSVAQVSVTAQLLATGSGALVWSASFERGLAVGYLFDLQGDVADAVAGALGAGLMPRESSASSAYLPESMAAYDDFQQGMFYLRQIETGVARNYEAAVTHFESALGVEPGWAAAHAALGRVLHFQASGLAYSDGAPLYRRSKEHLLRAIELDPDYGPAHESLGFVLHIGELDFEGAAAAYQRAMELGVTQYWGPAIFLVSTGQFDAAIEMYRMALDRDPLSLGLKRQLAGALYCAGRYAESIEHHERLLETTPDSLLLQQNLAYLYLSSGELEKGTAILEQYPELLGEPGGSGYFYALTGRDDEARKEIDLAEADPDWRPDDVVPPALLLGQKDRALTYLEAVATESPRSLTFVLCAPEVRLLAGDPRFERVLDTVGFPRRYLRGQSPYLSESEQLGSLSRWLTRSFTRWKAHGSGCNFCSGQFSDK
jgi:TolB-like protein/DNA-binding winged helix-turn-helix (wHTH) protein/Flp pilus assembly protein TadD